MRAPLIAFLLLVLQADFVLAKDLGWIGIFADESAGSCQIMDSPGVVTAYILHVGAEEANTSQFKLEIDPTVQMTFLAGVVNPDYLYIGNVLEGIVITYRQCRRSFPLKLVTLTFYGQATTTSCGALRIVPDPDVESGQVEVVDCSFNVRPVPTSSAWVNNTGDCVCVTPAKATMTTLPPGLQVIVDSRWYVTPCSFWWEPGTTHEISTPVSQGPGGVYTFESWSDGGPQTHDVVMGSEDTTFTATFDSPPEVFLETNPPGLTLTVDDESQQSPYHAFWATGESHEIGAPTPQGTDSMYTFTSWSDGGAPTHTLVMGDEDTTLTATFELGPHVLLETVPAGLAVLVDSVSHAAPYDAYWAPGSIHELSAPSPQGTDSMFMFVSWGDGGARTHAIVMSSADTAFTATFELAPRVSLETVPTGLLVLADGISYTAPHDVFWMGGTEHDVSVTDYLSNGDSVLAFDSWSDGGPHAHVYTAAGVETTLTAAYANYPVEAGCFGLFTDQLGSSCRLDDTGSQLVDVYVIHKNPSMVNQSRLRIRASGGGFACVYVGETSALATVGNTQSGLEAFYGYCATSDVVVTKVTYQCNGDSYPSYLEVAAHPGASSGKIETLDCGGGVWTAESSPFYVNSDGPCDCGAVPVGVKGSEPIPPRVVLKQNTPNPFNPVTRVEFSVPSPRFVELSIFDVGGKFVKRLYAREAPAGFTTVTWTGLNERGEAVGSGVYFCQLRTGDERYTRKMVLLK